MKDFWQNKLAAGLKTWTNSEFMKSNNTSDRKLRTTA
jgi:hypothetical protein